MDKEGITFGSLLRRINSNESIAAIFVIGYLAYLFYYTGMSFEAGTLPENPALNILLGVMSTCLVLIIQYYFRTRQPPTAKTT